MSGKGKGGRGSRMRQNRSAKAGLQFPVARVSRYLRERRQSPRVGSLAPVYLTAVLEYLAAEILEVAGNKAKEAKRQRITPRHVMFAINGDDELSKLLGKNTTIADSGVTPSVHPAIIPKNSKAKRKSDVIDPTTPSKEKKSKKKSDKIVSTEPKIKKQKKQKNTSSSSAPTSALTAFSSSSSSSSSSSAYSTFISPFAPVADTIKIVPQVWRFDTSAPTFGIYVSERFKQVWVGNNNGDVYLLNSADGQVQKHIKLPFGVKCVVADSHWVYAGCDNGAVYDLSQETVRMAYRVGDQKEDEKGEVKTRPKHIVFVLDASGSMAGSRMKASAHNMNMIFDSCVQPDDKITLIRFDDRIFVACANQIKSKDETWIRQCLSNTSTGGSTAFWDGLKEAFDKLTGDDNYDQFVVALTDGDDNCSRSNPAEIVELARKSKANVLTIGVGTLSRHAEIESICKATANGLFLQVGTSSSAIDEAFKQVAQILSSNVTWLDVRDGMIAVSDKMGGIVLCNIEGEKVWEHAPDEGKTEGGVTLQRGGWMCRHDHDLSGVYHGTGTSVSKYSLATGNSMWKKEVPSAILFGWQSLKSVYACSGKSVIGFAKETGQEIGRYDCSNTVVSNAASDDDNFIFAGDTDGTITAFKGDGKQLWRLRTDCGTALSMQYISSTQQLFVVTTKGLLTCMDVSEKSIENLEKVDRKIISVQAPSDLKTALPSSSVDVTADASKGVLVECVMEGGRLRVRAVSHPFNADFNVQFPKNLRANHAKFVVEELVLGSSGTFYRAKGNISRLESADAKYQILTADKHCQIKDLITNAGKEFKKGCAFYEHTKKETIQSYKAIVLQDRGTGSLYEGDAVRQLLGLPVGDDATKVQPTDRHTDRYRLFVQSTSANRQLPSGASALYKL